MPCVSQSPVMSGLPSAVFGAGADRFGLPSGVRGIPGVGYLIHCADTDTVVSRSAPMVSRLAFMRDVLILLFCDSCSVTRSPVRLKADATSTRHGPREGGRHRRSIRLKVG